MSQVNQIKFFTKKINDSIKENSNNGSIDENHIEKITSQDLKLNLIIQVKELINSENIDKFKELICLIKKITLKAKQLYAI